MSKLVSSLFAGVAFLPCAAFAQQAIVPLPPVDITADRVNPGGDAAGASGEEIVSGSALYSRRVATNDAAQMLSSTPGLSFYQAGGVSSLPVIHGFNDDRNTVVLGGVPITAACANHMNPPLSFIDPAAIGRIEVFTANVPVSKGGDAIGGAIIVTPRAPVFASAAAPVATKGPLLALAPGVVESGSISTYYRSNGQSLGVSGHVNVATEHFSLQYDGAWSKSNNYQAGGGATVASTLYDANNHAATLAYQNDGQIITFHYAHQAIPYQGFPNQWMDMMGNNANTFDLSYKGLFAWGGSKPTPITTSPSIT